MYSEHLAENTSQVATLQYQTTWKPTRICSYNKCTWYTFHMYWY